MIQSVVRFFSDTDEPEATLEDRRFILQDEMNKWNLHIGCSINGQV